ncbi:hypothetical protein HF086_001052 [Spodoptera exigua]|uniref:RNA helicase n=1 Tax=Spodoptera exigua TaxID=7107 RepID=A0A922M5R1_SPOEX|nr:hypothetical protein HF086_001052 [Spodoptera exigua]
MIEELKMSLKTDKDGKPNKCKVCSLRNVEMDHFETEKHKQNACLKQYTTNKSQFIINRKKVVSVCCEVTSSTASTNSIHGKIKVSVKPDEPVQFKFTLTNESRTNCLEVVEIDLAHLKFNFELPNNPYKPGCEPYSMPPKTKLPDKIVVSFKSPHIGQYETPILFNLKRKDDSDETIVLLREMVVFVEKTVSLHDNIISPYERKKVWAKELVRSTRTDKSDDIFGIPKTCKKIYANKLNVDDNASEAEKDLASDIRHTFDVGITEDNYVKFFHNLLWYEETVIRVNIKETCYSSGLITNKRFTNYYAMDGLFDIRFFLSRISLERMHKAVNDIRNNGHYTRIFPKENECVKKAPPILNYFNPLVEANLEQRCAVECIVTNSSGTAPYLLHGPPGTGKTITIVEAILQLAISERNYHIMVCTDSNMAADHVASMLIQYSHLFPKSNWLLRANSKFRNWETLPKCLLKYSNGRSRHHFINIAIKDFMSYRIVVTTLSHAAKFGRYLSTSLMERLKKDNSLYSDSRNDPNYVIMLRNNFRSHPDILEIPDKLFYKGQLRACSTEDPLSTTDILGEKETSRAIVFHGVLSKEERIGKSPSFFNMMECEMVLQYVKRLVQVYQIKKSLTECGFNDIEVGTVEAYQGKEKRVVIISTRFNVAITRAKAKVIIIGNPLCLEKDVKWRMYMDRCRELGTYHGFDSKIVSDDSSQQIIDKLGQLIQRIEITAKETKN